MLLRSEPFREKRRLKVDCLVCRNDGKGSCHSTGVTYELVFQDCWGKYIGDHHCCNPAYNLVTEDCFYFNFCYLLLLLFFVIFRAIAT